MAEAVFQDMVDKAGLRDQIRVDSAGTGNWHVGEPPHSGTRRVLYQHGIPYHGQARQINSLDFEQFDYILVMDDENLQNVQKYASDSKAEVSKFLNYAKQAGTVQVDEVPDPYYNGQVELVYDLVKKGSEALLSQIRKTHGL
jgi:protein-tyrosine phosphatase